ncbi:MAG TPA: erythromycin esterase family protein, partial [Acidimicrobiia bacterium]|nr:erythromycin esterase family protein [Acidimicrobiia bacterium]
MTARAAIHPSLPVALAVAMAMACGFPLAAVTAARSQDPPQPTGAPPVPPSAAVPLASTEPAVHAAPPAADLAALEEWLGDARLVGLGENFHGSHTLHLLAHRIFAHLAAEAGFEVFAVEIDQAHAALLDEWVQGGCDDLEELLASSWRGSSIFDDAALVDMLRWMRRYNETATRPVHFAGYD